MLVKKASLPIGHILLVGWLPSALKKFIYRRMGYDIGANVHLSFGSVVIGRRVRIGDEAQLGMLSIIQGRTLCIGPRVRIGMLTIIDCPIVEIGEGTRINNQVVVGGMLTPDSAFRMGRNCILMEWSFVNTTQPVTIGDDVGIGGHCLFFTHGMWPNTFEGFPSKYAPIRIEDQAWLAWRVAVLPGVTIGRRSIISSDACVVKDIPQGALAAGVPAKVLQEREAFLADDSLSVNKERLLKLLGEFGRWLEFHDMSSQWIGERSMRIGHPGVDSGSSILWLRYEESDPLSDFDAGEKDCLVSLPLLTPEARAQIESAGLAWIDVQSKERSRRTNPLIEEMEEYLHRGGLRLLKYSSWRKD